MLKVQTTDGKTHKIDLSDQAVARKWARRLLDPSFQASISAMSITQKGVQYTLARPRDFREQDIHFGMEYLVGDERWQGGEEITGFFGDVRVSMLVHHSQRAARVSATRTGKRVHIPEPR